MQLKKFEDKSDFTHLTQEYRIKIIWQLNNLI